MSLKAEAWPFCVAVCPQKPGEQRFGDEGDMSISGVCLLNGSTVACAGHLKSLRRSQSGEEGRGEEGEGEGARVERREGAGGRGKKAVTVVSFFQGKSLMT